MRPPVLFTLVLATAMPTPAQEKSPAPDLLESLVGADARASSRAGEELLRMGSHAVPILRRGLGRDTAFDSADAKRILAILRRLRRAAVSALPDLIRALTEARSGHDEILKTIDALAPYDPDRKTELIEAIANLWMNRSSVGDRRMSAQAIAVSRTRLDVNSAMTATQLVDILGSGDTAQRDVAAELLVSAPGDNEKKLAALRACLADTNRGSSSIRVRFQTARMSASIATSAPGRDNERISVARALTQLAPTRDVPVEAWVYLLRDEEPRMLRRAMQAVGLARPGTAVPALITLTRHADPSIRWEAITTLGMLGPVATDAITTLEELAKSPEKATAVRASSSLRMIRPPKK